MQAKAEHVDTSSNVKDSETDSITITRDTSSSEGEDVVDEAMEHLVKIFVKYQNTCLSRGTSHATQAMI